MFRRIDVEIVLASYVTSKLLISSITYTQFIKAWPGNFVCASMCTCIVHFVHIHLFARVGDESVAHTDETGYEQIRVCVLCVCVCVHSVCDDYCVSGSHTKILLMTLALTCFHLTTHNSIISEGAREILSYIDISSCVKLIHQYLQD